MLQGRGRSRIALLARAECLVDSLDHHRFHERVAVEGRMASVLRKACVEAALSVVERRVVIDIDDSLSGGILPEQGIERADLLGRRDLGPPRETVARQHGAEHHADAVVLGQLAHRNDVSEGILKRDRTLVLRDVVDAGQDHHRPRMKVDHVAAETGQHLERRLAADAASHKVVPGKEFGVDRSPVVGDRIAHEDRLDGLPRQFGVLTLIASVLCPVPILLSRERRGAEKRQRQQKDFLHIRLFVGFRFCENKSRKPRRNRSPYP